MENEKARINLKADKTRLLGEKNSLVAKKKELRTEIVVLNAAGPPNILICSHQNLFLRLTRDKFKAKRLLSFDGLKENLQRFFTKTRYYQRFYQQSLLFDSDKI